MSVLSEIEPKKVFEYFEAICNIPHGSGNTLAISNYLADFAKTHELDHVQDSSNNVIIYKKGTDGYEQSAPVILQGHMDMVCVKDESCTLNLETDGLSLCLEKGLLHANGTSLGGDDGIAVAMMLALLDAEDIPHPPLEAVFTVDEEIGMLGAAALDYSLLSGRTMLNLDSEEEGYLLVSCAGGATAICRLPVRLETPPENIRQNYTRMRIRISGISGGHSGMEIIKQGANANQLLGRLLYDASKQTPLFLCRLEGGSKDNAIATEAFADVYVEKTNGTDAIYACTQTSERIFRHEYRYTDPAISITQECLPDTGTEDIPAAEEAISVMDLTSTRNVIAMLFNLPNGVIKMSQDLPGLVQTSLNFGILNTDILQKHSGMVTCSFSVRSSTESEKDALLAQLECLTQAFGGSVSVSGNYPAWEYKKDSELLPLMTEVYQELFGAKPVVQSIHAGVECGLFCEHLPGLDCVSYGPDMKDIHTSRETLDIESVKRTWNYTLEILKRLR